MALEISELKRVFTYDGQTLEDIEGATLKEVAKAYSGQYPALLNSTPNYVETKDGVEYYDFSAKAGLKG